MAAPNFSRESCGQLKQPKYRWKIGNGRKVKFWEDNWLGSYNLAIQFWDLYMIMNEKNKTVQELWDGTNLKCTFRRIVNPYMFREWRVGGNFTIILNYHL
jgi:hypothetical protein